MQRLIDIQDHCGGLGVGDKEDMFCLSGKSGIGRGVAISRRSVEANKGVLSVRYIPSSSCVFTITLPKVESPEDRVSLPLPKSVSEPSLLKKSFLAGLMTFLD